MRDYIARLRAGEVLPALTTTGISQAGKDRVLESRLSFARMGGKEVLISTTRDISGTSTAHPPRGTCYRRRRDPGESHDCTFGLFTLISNHSYG